MLVTVRVQLRVLGVAVAPLGAVDAVPEHAALAHAAAGRRARPVRHALPGARHPPRERVERRLLACRATHILNSSATCLTLS